MCGLGLDWKVTAMLFICRHLERFFEGISLSISIEAFTKSCIRYIGLIKTKVFFENVNRERDSK
jgi:hypothetical protein